MWFYLGFKNFIGKKHFNDDFCDIFISDFMRIWHKSLSNDELLSICQTLNPLLEAPAQKLRDVTLNLLEDVKVLKNIKEENKNIVIKLQSNIMGIKFQFQVELNQGDEEMLFKELTIPLLLLIENTQKREKKLMEIIEEKDAEIKYYRQEYGIVSSYLTTKIFSKNDFCFSKISSKDIPWDPNSFLECISAKLLSIESVPKAKEEQQLVDEKSQKNLSVDTGDEMKSIIKNKSITESRSSCVLLSNQVIKKRKKHNEGFKIKF